MKVKYAGHEPINPEILTRRYEYTYQERVINTNAMCCIVCCWCTTWFFPCISCHRSYHEDSAAVKQQNVNRVNEFISQALIEADQEVSKRIQAIKPQPQAMVRIEMESNQKEIQALQAQLDALKQKQFMSSATATVTASK